MSNTTTYPTLHVAPCRTCDGKGTMREGFPERDWPCRECRGSKLDYGEAFRAAYHTTRKAIFDGHTDPEGIASDALELVRFAIRAEVKREAESHAETWGDGESGHDDVSDYTHEAADQSHLVFITHLSQMVALLAEDEDHEQAQEYGRANDGSMVTTLAFCVLRRHIEQAIDALGGVEIDGYGTVHAGGIEHVRKDDDGDYELRLANGDTVYADEADMEALRADDEYDDGLEEGVEAAAKAGSHAGRLDAIMATADEPKPSGSVFYVIVYPARAGVEALGPRKGEYGRTPAEALASLRAKVSDALRGVEA